MTALINRPFLTKRSLGKYKKKVYCENEIGREKPKRGDKWKNKEFGITRREMDKHYL